MMNIPKDEVLWQILQEGRPLHLKIKGNQIRGPHRTLLQKQCLTVEPHILYKDLVLKHKEEVLKYGNSTKIPSKGIRKFYLKIH